MDHARRREYAQLEKFSRGVHFLPPASTSGSLRRSANSKRLPGGIGIVADDVMAGLYGALAIFVLDRFRIF